jgi:SNF2 family DNA or RNA helicase
MLRWWNSSTEDQAIDRVYRIGQRKTVHVHKMIVRSTFEERIDDMIEKKRDLTNMTIGTGEMWISKMSNSELKDLFALSTGEEEENGGDGAELNG